MENMFFEFVETYWSDIAAFLRSFIDFVKSIVEKVQG